MPRATSYPTLTSPMWIWPSALIVMSTAGAGSGGAWPTANLALYIPFSVPVDAVASGVSFNCTTGNSAGRNYDLGIFHGTSFVKMASSGATLTGAGLNTWSTSTPLIGGAPYLLGMSMTSTSLQVWRRAPTATQSRALGFAQEASANPLPATATPAQWAQTYAPILTMTFANLP